MQGEHESRIEILETELLHARGIQATTHNQVCAPSGLSKLRNPRHVGVGGQEVCKYERREAVRCGVFFTCAPAFVSRIKHLSSSRYYFILVDLSSLARTRALCTDGDEDENALCRDVRVL